MKLSAQLQQCHALVEQGEIDQALRLLTAEGMNAASLVTAGEALGQNPVPQQELAQCLALVDQLLDKTEHQQQQLSQRLRAARAGAAGRTAYAESAGQA